MDPGRAKGDIQPPLETPFDDTTLESAWCRDTKAPVGRLRIQLPHRVSYF
jgi:hypothetical protein